MREWIAFPEDWPALPHWPETPRSRNARGVLLVAGQLLQSHGWCQRALTVDQYGRPASPWSPEATSMDIICAIERAVHHCRPWTEKLTHDVYSAVHAAIGTRDIAYWQDTPGRTKRQVLAALHRAARLA